jgi:trimeric autotransporter adhesin
MKTNVLSLLLIPVIISFAPLPAAQGVSPAPDGGYPGGNTAEGQNALLSLTSGNYNTAVGFFSLLNTNNSSFNTALGAGTLLANGGGSNNTATGTGALLNNTIGGGNSANGAFALFNNSTGSGNIALGNQAGFSLTTGNNNIDIGNIGFATESNTIRIGDAAIHTGIFLAGITAMSPSAPNQVVLVDPGTGQLGSADASTFGVVITDPENTAVGDQALVSNTGESNTATGFRALFSNHLRCQPWR